jgi:hypothetical protein
MISEEKPLPLRLPASLKAAALKEAQNDGISLQRFITQALAEKMAWLEELRRRNIASTQSSQKNMYAE